MAEEKGKGKKKGISRRDFIKGSGFVVGGAAISSALAACAPAEVVEVEVPGPTVEVPGPTVEVPGPTVEVPGPTIEVPGPTQQVEVPGPTVEVEVPVDLPKFIVNGVTHEIKVKDNETLLEILRGTGKGKLEMTGTKESCTMGICGACTVIIDGQRRLACTTLAVEAQGKSVLTIEGLSTEAVPLSVVQEGFLDEEGFECGYCTPGQIMSATAFLAKNSNPTMEEVQREMSGNMCACGTYGTIQRAVLAAAAKM